MIKRRQLDWIAVGMLLTAAWVVRYAPIFNGSSQVLTIALPEYVSSAIDPDMEIADDGSINPAFEAWAIVKLRKGK